MLHLFIIMAVTLALTGGHRVRGAEHRVGKDCQLQVFGKF